MFPTPQVMVPSPPGLTGDGLLLCLHRSANPPAQVNGFILQKFQFPYITFLKNPLKHPTKIQSGFLPGHSDEPRYGTDAKLGDVLSCSVMSDSLQPHGLWPMKLFCPWNSPGKNIGVGCCSLLQGIFLIQGLNPGLLYCRWILYCLSHEGFPPISLTYDKNK